MQPSALIQATCIFVIIFSTTLKADNCVFRTFDLDDNTLTCSDLVGSVTICLNNVSKAENSIVITKENEGEYFCCCGIDNCNNNCVNKVAYGEQTVIDGISSNLKVKWGDPVNIPCAYTPGALISEPNADEFYELKWRFIPKFKDGSETLFPRLSNDAQHGFKLYSNNNTIKADVFNPLKDQGSYQCTVELKMSKPNSSPPFSINVTEAIDSSKSTSITSPPTSQITSIEDGTAQFNCLVEVPSYKPIGFKISGSIDNSLKQEIVADMNDDNCTLDGSTVTCALNGPTPLTLSCSYDIPYEINCNLNMRNLTEKNSSMISCFVDENPQVVVSKPVNLFIKPQLNCLSNSIERIDRVLNYTFEYPITVPVTLSFTEDGGNTYIITADLYDDNKTISVQVPGNILTGRYSILFNGSTSGISCPFNFSEGNTTNLSPTTTTLFDSTSITTTVEVSSTFTYSMATSDSLTVSASVSPNFGGTESKSLPLQAVVGASVSVFILVVLVIFLVCMLVIVTKISGRRKRDEYQLAHNEVGKTYYVEKGNQLKSMTHNLSPDQLSPDHLSPEQSTQCDSCSHASTYTFITDEPSPRHHQPSHSSRSSHSRSSNSCPSTSHLKNKPLPRYGIPDHYPQYQMHQNHPTSLPFGPNPPDITVITPTPTMEDQPVLEPVADYIDCMSPTGTEPFSSPNTPASDDRYDYFTSKKEQSRPSDLPISPLAKTPDSSASTPLSDQTMIGVLLYLQHKDCDKKENCQMCKLISRHFERIAKKYGENVLKGMVKNLNTPGGDGTLKHLRKREKKVQRLRSPHRPQVPSLAVTTTQYQRQRSHSASHIDEEELTFSSTETDDDSLKPSNKRVKPIRIRKAITDDEKDEYSHQRNKLPLQRISEISVSDFDLPSTLSNSAGLFPGSVPNKGSESDSTDGSTSSRMEFDSSKPSGLSMSFMKSPETSLPVNFHSDHQKNLTLTSYNSSSGYETDNVFDHYRSTSNDTDERGDSPPQHVIPNNAHHHVANGHLTSRNTDAYGRRHSDHRPIRYTSDDNMSHSVRSDTGSCYNHQYSQPTHQSDYSKAMSLKRQAQAGLGSNLSNNGSRVLSMHSSPGGNNSYRSQSSNGSNQSNHSIHSESALRNYPRTQNQLSSSPPGQRKIRTPSPIQVVLPNVTSSATPI